MTEEQAPQSSEQETSIESLQEEITSLTDSLKRVQAEFQNYQRRVEQERVHLIRQANKNLLLELLPLFDDFDRALVHKDIEGFTHIAQKFKEILHDVGLTKIEAHNAPFNPLHHEALLVEQTDNKEHDNTVVEVLEPGYMLHDDIIKHAKVKVAKYQGGNENE
ncbi:MAG: nucleotide exchange factor GrpE [Candidatus Woesearchaeota archaeon]